MKYLLTFLLYYFIAMRITFPNAFEFAAELMFNSSSPTSAASINTSNFKTGLKILLNSEDKTYMNDATINNMISSLESGGSVEAVLEERNQENQDIKKMFVEYCLKKRKLSESNAQAQLDMLNN
jgi:hypothetical protein